MFGEEGSENFRGCSFIQRMVLGGAGSAKLRMLQVLVLLSMLVIHERTKQASSEPMFAN